MDEYGFERPDDFDYKAYDEFMSKYMEILTRRSIRWSTIINQKSLSDGRTLKRFVRKGVPAQYRGKVCKFISICSSNLTGNLFYNSYYIGLDDDKWS